MQNMSDSAVTGFRSAPMWGEGWRPPNYYDPLKSLGDSTTHQDKERRLSRMFAVFKERLDRRGFVPNLRIIIPAPSTYRDVTPESQQRRLAQGQDPAKIPEEPKASATRRVKSATAGGGRGGASRGKDESRPSRPADVCAEPPKWLKRQMLIEP